MRQYNVQHKVPSEIFVANDVSVAEVSSSFIIMRERKFILVILLLFYLYVYINRENKREIV